MLFRSDIYKSDLPAYRQKLRERFCDTFGDSVVDKDGNINRSRLAKIVFNDTSGKKFKLLDDLMREPLETEFRQNIYNKRGLIVINAAIAPERDWLYVSNNNAILIDIDQKTQVDRLTLRNGYSREEAKVRIKKQRNFRGKKKLIAYKQKADDFGKLVIFDNNGELSEKKISELYDQILGIFPRMAKKLKSS